MITIEDAKAIARELSRSGATKHSQALEAAARAAGFRDWNTFVAKAAEPVDAAAQRVIPILRVFDHHLAKDFYCDFLGFRWEWQHQFEPDFPVYAQVEREGATLHLSEHHGDATPGSAVMIVVADVARYRDQLQAHAHPPVRPAIEENPWGLTMTVLDPFGNRLIFWQR